MRRFALLLVGACLTACGSSPPVAPSAAAATRIMALGGNLSFGAVIVGTTATGLLTIANSGNATLAFTGISGPCGSMFAASVTAGSVAPGTTASIAVGFTPTAVGDCSGSITVTANQTAGATTIPISASGVAPPAVPITETFSGTISGGDRTSCVRLAGTFALTDAPCSVFTITSASVGRLDATLTFNRNDALLSLDLYDVTQGRVVATGALDTSKFPTYSENLSSNVSPGRYELHVTVTSSSQIAAFTITTTHPK